MASNTTLIKILNKFLELLSGGQFQIPVRDDEAEDNEQDEGGESRPQKEASSASKSSGQKFDFNQFIRDLQRKASGLSDGQWGMLAAGIFMLGYGGYELLPVLLESSAPPPPQIMEARQGETAEEKFRRENKNISLPDGSALSAQEIEEKTQLTQQIPFGDKELEFQVRLPKNWFMSQFARYGLPGEENYSVLTNIARYFGPAVIDQRPYLWVEVERMKRYMTAEAWAKAYMIKRGISPQAMEVVSPTEVQALYVDVRDLQSYAVRGLFRVEGDTMILVTYGVPVDIYKEHKDMMAVTLKSFRLTHMINREVEVVNTYNLMKVLQFKHFTSWLPRNAWMESTLRPSVELHNLQEEGNKARNMLQGIILINVWRDSPQFPHQRNLQDIKKRLLDMSLTLKDDTIAERELPLYGNFVSIKQSEYLAQVNNYVRRDQFDIVKSQESMTNQEVWITVLNNDYYTVYLTLVSPLRGTNYVVWAQNVAAYELLIESLRIRGLVTVE